MLMTATLEVSGRAIKVKLRNLSAEGAQVEGSELPVEGTELLFRKGELAVAGSIIWTKGKQAGIGFAVDLDPATVLNHVPVPRPRKTDDFRRPGPRQSRAVRSGTLAGSSLDAVGPSPNVGD